MPQTGKTPKKQSSESQQQFKKAYSVARQQAGNISATTDRATIGADRTIRRREQTQGRMTFGRGSFGHRVVDTATDPMAYSANKKTMALYNPAVPVPERWMLSASRRMAQDDYNRQMWKQRKVARLRQRADVSKLMDDVKTRKPRTPVEAAMAIAKSGTRPNQDDILVPRRVSNMRDRPRGKSVTGMMGLAGFGLGQMLREKMMAQQPSRNR